MNRRHKQALIRNVLEDMMPFAKNATDFNVLWTKAHLAELYKLADKISLKLQMAIREELEKCETIRDRMQLVQNHSAALGEDDAYDIIASTIHGCISKEEVAEVLFESANIGRINYETALIKYNSFLGSHKVRRDAA